MLRQAQHRFFQRIVRCVTQRVARMERSGIRATCCTSGALRLPPGLQRHRLGRGTRAPQVVPAPPPSDNDRSFLDSALDVFSHTPALILLAQEYRVPRTVLTELEADLNERFPAVRHLVSPAARRSSPRAYFSALAKRLELDAGVDDDAALEDALWDRLRNGTPLCLLISRLEKGDGERADEFAGVLRNLLEDPGLRLHVLLCGGQKLAELRFAGVLSLLNSAALLEWPEYTVDDVQRLYSRQFPGPEPAPDATRDLLARMRQVYWLNLLTVRGGRLMWHCEAVREAGRTVLGMI